MRTTISIFILLFFFSCTKKENELKTNTKITEITNYLDTLEGFSGAVLIAKNDSILLKKAYGYAHIGHSVKNNTSTKFTFASIGKSFTSVAIFQLIESGKLSIDDPIGKYIPEYPNPLVRDSVTIKLLLSHRSGLPNYFHAEKFLNTPKTQFRTLESLNNLYENESLESKPNEQFAYRNTNYILLGRIIESITKKPYEEYLRDHIFVPTEMKNTGNFDADHPLKNAAENYTLSDVYPNKLQKNIFMSAVKGSAAGGGYSTIEDLYKFATAFKNNKLLNTKYTSMMKTKPENHTYGYGMQFSSTKGSGIYGHSGGHFGVGTEWRVFEKQGYTVILLTNKDSDQGFLDTRFFIEKTITGSTPKLERYFFTKKVIKTCLDSNLEEAKKQIAKSNTELYEMDINSKGYEMIKRGFYKKAITLFKLEVFAFPKSSNAYDSLGEAYMLYGDVPNAIKNYKKSLVLDPENDNATQKIKALLLKKEK